MLSPFPYLVSLSFFFCLLACCARLFFCCCCCRFSKFLWFAGVRVLRGASPLPMSSGFAPFPLFSFLSFFLLCFSRRWWPTTNNWSSCFFFWRSLWSLFFFSSSFTRVVVEVVASCANSQAADDYGWKQVPFLMENTIHLCVHVYWLSRVSFSFFLSFSCNYNSTAMVTAAVQPIHSCVSACGLYVSISVD
jgi:hypothetical protein